jgi:hypothetical protein
VADIEELVMDWFLLFRHVIILRFSLASLLVRNVSELLCIQHSNLLWWVFHAPIHNLSGYSSLFIFDLFWILYAEHGRILRCYCRGWRWRFQSCST